MSVYSINASRACNNVTTHLEERAGLGEGAQ